MYLSLTVLYVSCHPWCLIPDEIHHQADIQENISNVLFEDHQTQGFTCTISICFFALWHNRGSNPWPPALDSLPQSYRGFLLHHTGTQALYDYYSVENALNPAKHNILFTCCHSNFFLQHISYGSSLKIVMLFLLSILILVTGLDEKTFFEKGNCMTVSKRIAKEFICSIS